MGRRAYVLSTYLHRLQSFIASNHDFFGLSSTEVLCCRLHLRFDLSGKGSNEALREELEEKRRTQVNSCFLTELLLGRFYEF